MNTTMMRVLKAVVGVVILFILLTVVAGWWQDFKEATPSNTPPVTTSTPTPTVDPADASDEKADEKADEKPAAASKTVVVLIDGLNLRQEPATDGKRIRGLKKGDQLALLGTKGSWHQVRAEDDQTGWISANPQYTKIEE